MSVGEANADGPPSPDDRDERMPRWLIALAAVAALLVGVVLFTVVVPAIRDQRSAARSTSNAGTAITSTTVAPEEPAEESPNVAVSGPVAYVSRDGLLLVGDGAGEPAALAADAAVGDSGLGSVAIAPTGDVVAYVRSDGALVMVDLPIGGAADPPVVLATDASLSDLGAGRAMA